MQAPLTETQIVHGLQIGDRQAFDALCREYGVRLWNQVARLVGDRDAVEEVFQETMLAVAKGGRSLAADTRLWGWLSKVSHNQSALYWRKRYRSHPSGDQPDNLASRDCPVESAERVELVGLIRSILAEMSAENVAVLTAKYLDGLSVADIVETVGGTSESVRSRLARARKEFRSRYEESVHRESAETPAVPDTSSVDGDLK